MSDSTILDAAVDTYCRARETYDERAAFSKAHPYSLHAQAQCDRARRALARADDALVAAWRAMQADPIPALLAKLEAVEVARPVVAAPGETLEESAVGANRYVMAEEGEP